jgi:arylsulfatase A-like enzyme
MRILLVDIDSLRPDHLSAYGYDRDTSPTIDRIADEGVRFDRCLVSDSPCLPSRTALATCRFGTKTGVVAHYGEGQWYDNPGSGHDVDPDRAMSFYQLAHEGIRTTSVSSFAERHQAYHFSGAFQESIQPTAETGLLAVEDATDVTESATTWLDAHAEEDDWLLHVNYWDVHHPYVGVDEYKDKVRESGEPAPWPDDEAVEAQQGMTGTRTADLWPNPEEYGADWYDEKYGESPMPERIESREDAVQIIDGYDAAIRKVDDAVERLLAKLEAAGIREETAVIVTGDHGEALGEHGIYAEHSLPHPACQRVPLIVSWPGVTDDAAGATVDEHVYQFDLMPTICDLLDVPIPAKWDAEAFTPALRGGEFDGREFVVSGHGIYTFGRAVYRDDWLYVRLLHPGVFHHPGLFNDPDLPDDGLGLLHDLSEDPHQTENLIDERPEVADELRSTLDRWLVEQTSDEWNEHQPVETRGRDPLARMASYGPYLYVDPEDLLGLYRDLDRSDEQIAQIERSLEQFPSAPTDKR